MGADYNSTGGYYYVKFFIDGSEETYFESNFDSIRIVNRIDNNYPLVFIDLDIDNQRIIEPDIYPHKNIDLEIYYSDEDNKIFGEPLKLKLLILEMNVDLPIKYMHNISEKWEVVHKHTILTCVPKECHEIMNVTINRMWEKPVTVSGAVISTINELGFPKEIDMRKINSKLIPQLLVPPMSFRNFLYYMDDRYGLYNGRLFFYVDWNGTFKMWELKRKFDDYKPGGIYTVHKMPSFSKNEEATYEIPAKLVRSTPNNYITYNEMKTICRPNDVFINNGGKQYHIFHPKYDISQIQEWDPIGQAEKNGIHSGKINLKLDNGLLKKRIVVFDDTIGDENNATAGTEILANFIEPAYKTNYIHYSLIRKVKPHLMMRVGEPIRIQMYAESEKKPPSDYSGSYMVLESIMTLTRDQGPQKGNDTVFIKCDVKACRTSPSNS